MTALSACSSLPSAVKLYESIPEQNALVRKQGGESIPYEQSAGYMCISKSDLERLLLLLHKGNPTNVSSSY